MEYKIGTTGQIKDISGVKEMTPEMLEFWNGAYNEGFEDGKVKGIGIGKSEIKPVKDKLESVTRSFLEEKEKLLKSSETSIFELVKEIAKRVIKIEINENSKKIVSETVNQIMKRIRDEERVIIKVSPVDFETIKSKESEWLNSLPYASKFQIVADGSISQGGCLIETASGKIDATIELKLKKLEEL